MKKDNIYNLDYTCYTVYIVRRWVLVVMRNKKNVDSLIKQNKKDKKKKEKKEYKLWEKIFIYGNISIIGIIIGIYLYRGIYYYKQMNTVSSDGKLLSVLINDNNIEYVSDGMYQEGDMKYYYKGKDVNNFVYYSGRLWRIVSIDSESIKLISDSNQSIMVWGYDMEYQDSYINKWLNYDKFIKSINQDGFLVEGEFCNKSISNDNDGYVCDEYSKGMVGLISLQEYLKAGGSESYLNNNSYFWTINYTDDLMVYYVNQDGFVNNVSYNNQDYYSYGVRPVINISSDVKYNYGSGSRNDPYMIDSNGSILKECSVGNYVEYNGYKWRILDILNDGVKLVLDGVLDEEIEYNNVDNYLNQEFIKKFDTDDLLKFDYYVNLYNNSNLYNYSDNGSMKNNYVGGLVVGDLFINDSSDYWLYNIQDSKEQLGIVVTSMSTLYGDLYSNKNGVRPVICVNGDFLVSGGNGTVNNPFLVGEW